MPSGAISLYKLLALFVQAPFHPASTGNEEEHETVKGGQLALVDCRKEIGSHLELPVELEIGHGHRAAAEKSRRASSKPQHHRQPAEKFDDPAEPELGPCRGLKVGKKSKDFLGAVKRKHESRHNTQQGISVI